MMMFVIFWPYSALRTFNYLSAFVKKIRSSHQEDILTYKKDEMDLKLANYELMLNKKIKSISGASTAFYSVKFEGGESE